MGTLKDDKILIHLFHLVMMTIPLLFCAQKIYKESIGASIKHMLLMTSLITIIVIFCDILYRFCYLLVELISVSNHMESMKTAAQVAFTFNTASVVIIVLSILLLSILINTVPTFSLKFIWEFGPSVCLPLLMFTLFLLRAINFYEWNIDRSVVSSMKGLDYGTGMAYSYYYGYLRIVLPSTGMANKGLLEKIENFEDVHNVTILVKKLFILIPSSSYIPPNLKEISNGWMESASVLEDDIRDRGGVQRRSYHNNVYKIYSGGQKQNNKQPVYIVVEGATPVLTFFEVQKHLHAESAVYKQYSKEIIKAFSTKLQELLHNDPDCKDISEVVYYNDYDADGNKINAANVLLDRISQITNRDQKYSVTTKTTISE